MFDDPSYYFCGDGNILFICFLLGLELLNDGPCPVLSKTELNSSKTKKQTLIN